MKALSANRSGRFSGRARMNSMSWLSVALLALRRRRGDRCRVAEAQANDSGSRRAASASGAQRKSQLKLVARGS